jgi:tetratricopeptide (TPR) repeat protein
LRNLIHSISILYLSEPLTVAVGYTFISLFVFALAGIGILLLNLPVHDVVKACTILVPVLMIVLLWFGQRLTSYLTGPIPFRIPRLLLPPRVRPFIGHAGILVGAGAVALGVLITSTIVVSAILETRRPALLELAHGPRLEYKATLSTFLKESVGGGAHLITAKDHFEAGEHAFGRGDFALAANEYCQSLNLTPTLSAHLNCGIALYWTGNLIKANDTLMNALPLAQQAGETPLYASLLITIGDLADAQGRLDDALRYYSMARTIARTGNDYRTEELALANVSAIYKTKQEPQHMLAATDASFDVITDALIKAGEEPRKRVPNLQTASELVDVSIVQTIHMPTPTALERAKRSLLAINYKDSPDVAKIYWVLAGKLISYPFLNNLNQSLIGYVPACPAISGSYKEDGDPIYNCQIVLDGYRFRDVKFVHVVIRYHGGPLELNNVVFQDCHFELSLPGSPPPEGEEFGRYLLRSNLSQPVLRFAGSGAATGTGGLTRRQKEGV